MSQLPFQPLGQLAQVFFATVKQFIEIRDRLFEQTLGIDAHGNRTTYTFDANDQLTADAIPTVRVSLSSLIP